MSWKDKRKNIGRARPKLDDVKVYCRKLEDGTEGFVAYNPETKTNELIGAELEGVYLGDAMKLECFDNKWAKNGGSYNSPYIFNVNNVVLFDPSGSRVYSGNYEGAKAFFGGLSLKPKLFKVLFVLVDGVIMAVHTNISISISQMYAVGDKLSLNTVVLKYSVYDKNTNIDKKTHERLGKIALTNPPKFADMTVGSPITDQYAEECNLEANQDAFEAFADYYNTTKVTDIVATDDDTSELPGGLKMTKADAMDIAQKTQAYNKGAAPEPSPDPESEEDLPF